MEDGMDAACDQQRGSPLTRKGVDRDLGGATRGVPLRHPSGEGEPAAVAELRQLTERLALALEDERRRVARDLHDDLGQILTALKLEFHELRRNLPAPQPRVARSLKASHALLDQAFQSLRRTISQLRDADMELRGLGGALQDLLSSFESSSGIRTRLTLPDEIPNLPPSVSLALYRITQEALTNVARHAGATGVAVRLLMKPGLLDLRIVDNGCGIRVERDFKPASYGLVGMRERMREIGGQFSIRGRQGMGTVLSVQWELTGETGYDSSSGR